MSLGAKRKFYGDGEEKLEVGNYHSYTGFAQNISEKKSESITICELFHKHFWPLPWSVIDSNLKPSPELFREYGLIEPFCFTTPKALVLQPFTGHQN